jgi:hypothetical protein
MIRNNNQQGPGACASRCLSSATHGAARLITRRELFKVKQRATTLVLRILPPTFLISLPLSLLTLAIASLLSFSSLSLSRHGWDGIGARYICGLAGPGRVAVVLTTAQ